MFVIYDRPFKITLRASFDLGFLLVVCMAMKVLKVYPIDNRKIKITIMLAKTKAILFLQRLLGLYRDS